MAKVLMLANAAVSGARSASALLRSYRAVCNLITGYVSLFGSCANSRNAAVTCRNGPKVTPRNSCETSAKVRYGSSVKRHTAMVSLVHSTASRFRRQPPRPRSRYGHPTASGRRSPADQSSATVRYCFWVPMAAASRFHQASPANLFPRSGTFVRSGRHSHSLQTGFRCSLRLAPASCTSRKSIH